MKVRMTSTITGTRNGVPWPPRGAVVDLPDAEAIDYVNADMAIPVTVGSEPERAVADMVDVEVRRAIDEPEPHPLVPRAPKEFKGARRR